MRNRTLEYWATRMLLVAGLIATAAVLLAANALAQPCFGCDYPDVLGLPPNILQAGLGVAVALFGLSWMIGILVRARRTE